MTTNKGQGRFYRRRTIVVILKQYNCTLDHPAVVALVFIEAQYRA